MVKQFSFAEHGTDFEEVLMVGEGAEVKIGAPLVEGGKVTAEVVSHGRGDKVNIIKFRRRKHSRTQQGHRQWYTEGAACSARWGTGAGRGRRRTRRR